MEGLLSGAGARLPVALLLLISHLRLSSGACPCEDPALCNPISGARDFEVRRRQTAS